MTSFVDAPDGVPVAYDAHGEGALALVLVHGWSCDRGYWRAQIAPLAERFRVVTVDLGGHGESGASRDAWTIAAFGADVAAVVDALALPRVALVGHSMGGDVVIEAARRLRGRVVGIVWVDVYRRLGTPRTAAQLDAFRAPFHARFADATRDFVRGLFPPHCDRAIVERIATDMASAPSSIALPCLHAASDYEREVPTALRDVALPLVAINPNDGGTDFASMAEHGIDVVTIPNVGHFPMIEDAEAFNRALAAAVERF